MDLEVIRILEKDFGMQEWMYTTPFLRCVQHHISVSGIKNITPYLELQMHYKTPIAYSTVPLSDTSTEYDSDLSSDYIAPLGKGSQGLKLRRSGRARKRPSKFGFSYQKKHYFGRFDISLVYFDIPKDSFQIALVMELKNSTVSIQAAERQVIVYASKIYEKYININFLYLVATSGQMWKWTKTARNELLEFGEDIFPQTLYTLGTPKSDAALKELFSSLKGDLML